MKISAKTEYACIAVLELAKNHGSSEPVRIRNIAEQHKVPPRFLVQILLQLKGAGIVSSTRGAAGGYHLIPKPEDVTLGQVMNIIEGPVQIPKRLSDPAGSSSVIGILGNVWDAAEQKRQNHLNGVTFADLVKLAAEHPASSAAPIQSSPAASTSPAILAPPPVPAQPQDPVVQESKPAYA